METVEDKLKQIDCKYGNRNNFGPICRGAVSGEERDFVENYGTHKQLELLKSGDIAHDQGNFKMEGVNHRNLQESLLAQGHKFRFTNEGRQTFAWNSLWVHDFGTVDDLTSYGRSNLDDNYYYYPKDHRYYLTPGAYQCVTENNIGHHFDGASSVVDPNPDNYYKQLLRNQSRNIYDDITPSSNTTYQRSLNTNSSHSYVNPSYPTYQYDPYVNPSYPTYQYDPCMSPSYHTLPVYQPVYYVVHDHSDYFHNALFY